MKRGETQTVEIVGWAEDGSGEARVGERSLRVPGVVVGDVVEVRIEHVSPQQPFVWGRALRWEQRGAGARKAPCHHAAPTRGKCGGCPVMHIEEAVQRELKVGIVNAALGSLGVRVEAVQHAGEALGYRCRSNFVASRLGSGRVVLGSFAPRSHEVARMSGCRVLRAPMPELIDRVAAALDEQVAPIHPEPQGLRYVGMRANGAGEVVVELIVQDTSAPWLAAAGAAIAALEGVVGVVASGNASGGNAIRVEAPALLAGVDRLVEEIAGLRVEVGCEVFTQLNLDVAGAMAEVAAAWAGPSASVIQDLYCGVGVLGLVVARGRAGARVFGAESHPGAVAAARQAAEAVGVEGAWIAHDLTAGLPTAWPRPELVIVNPPRRGLDRPVVEALAAGGAPVIYASCNPTSFAADAQALGASGYRVRHLQAWDMLPQTAHVELIAALERAGEGEA